VTSRALSILLLCAYVPLYRSEGLGSVVVVLCSCFLPLVCVWFPEPLADLTGGFVRASPPFLVWLFGWITLLMPLVLKLVVLYTFS
jgi:hypothetical protein